MRRPSADQLELGFTLAILGYSAVRVIPIWGALRDGSVNPWVFLIIDVGTAFPYAKSWPRLIRTVIARSWDKAVFWLAVLTGTFIAPYAYVFYAGENVASWVWWVLAVFIAAGVVSGVIRLRKGLRASPESPEPMVSA